MARIAPCLAFLIAAAVLAGCGVAKPYRPLTTLQHITNTQQKKNPPRLNNPLAPDKDRAVLIEDDAAWVAYWGEGEIPPKVDFTKNRVLVVVSWLASGGPGSLDIRALGYKDDKKAATRKILVREDVSGSWDTQGTYSRAYDISLIPRDDLTIHLEWRKSASSGVTTTTEEPSVFTP
jgi:hypothetical protein